MRFSLARQRLSAAECLSSCSFMSPGNPARSSSSHELSSASPSELIGEYPFDVPARLIARLSDGSEHEVKMGSGDPEQARQYLVKTDRRWVDVVGGSVRYDSIVSLLIVEESTDEERDRAINELLHDLQKRGGGTLEEVRHELEVRGIEISEQHKSEGRRATAERS